MRLLEDICTAFHYKKVAEDLNKKLSLWSILKSQVLFTMKHSCQKWDTWKSFMWRYLTKNRLEGETHIIWTIQSGKCNFWWDNWLGDGSLPKYCDHMSSLNNIQVSHFIEDGKWKEREVRQHAHSWLVPIIINTPNQHKVGVRM